jgi:hypothetical protein
MPAKDTIAGIPGKVGVDYDVVEYAGKYYVVYKSKLPGTKQVMLDGWRVTGEDFKKLNLQNRQITHLTRKQFKNVEVFGDFGEVVARGANDKPLKTWLKGLYDTYGRNVSWIQDPEYMETFFAGYMEGLDPGVIQQQLKRTKWYQSRTQAQRTWELDMNRADRKTATTAMETQVREALQDLYGTLYNDQQFTTKQLNEWAYDIASGKFGDPSAGFEEWTTDMTNKAEKIQGTPAWISREQDREEQRQFMNRPEDMFEDIRDDALTWLGPGAIPDKDTLQKWSQDLVSGVKSQADWEQYMQKQARSMYPWLGPDERWQDRASMYKQIVEDEMGMAVGYDDPFLKRISATDPNGKATGEALNFQDFTTQVRQSPLWENGKKAYEMGFDLYNQINNIFNGVR